MIRQTPKVIEALAHLKRDPRFQAVMEDWIIPSREEHRDRIEVLSGNENYREQGKSVELTEIIRAVEEADKALRGIAEQAMPTPGLTV